MSTGNEWLKKKEGRRLPTVSCTVWMATEVRKQPTVKLILYIQICHLIQKGTAAHVVKSLKSSAMTTTYGCVVSIHMAVYKIKISAAVVEPVGRKAYWSLKFKVGMGYYGQVKEG